MEVPPPPQRERRLSFLGASSWTLKSVDALILPNERRRYEQHFQQLDTDQDGLVQAPEGKQLLSRSKIPERIIDEIWSFCNGHSSRGLSCKEFTCAMHLTFQAMHVTSYHPPIQQVVMTPPEQKRPAVPPPWLLAAQQAYKSSQLGSISDFKGAPPELQVNLPISSRPEHWEKFSPTGPGSSFVNQEQAVTATRAAPSTWVQFEPANHGRRFHRHTSMPESQLSHVSPASTPPVRQPSGPFTLQQADYNREFAKSSLERTISPEPTTSLVNDQAEDAAESARGNVRTRRGIMGYQIAKRPFLQRKRARSLYGHLGEDLAVLGHLRKSMGEAMLSPLSEVPVSSPVAEPAPKVSLGPFTKEALRSGTEGRTSEDGSRTLLEGQEPAQQMVLEPLQQSAQILEVAGIVEGLQKEETSVRQDVLDIKKEASVLQKRLEELEGDKRRLEEQIAEGQAELQKLRSELDSKRAELIRLEDEMHELKRARTKVASAKDAVEQELLNTDTLLAARKEAVQAERVKLEHEEQQVVELQTKLQEESLVLRESSVSSSSLPALIVEVPSPLSSPAVFLPINQMETRVPMTPFSAFDGEDLLKLEAELGEGSCKQILADNPSPGAGGFEWPAISPPVTRMPSTIERLTAQQKEATSLIVLDDERKATKSNTPKESGTPGRAGGGILSPKRAPPPPPTTAAAAAPASQTPEPSPSKLRMKAVSMSLDWVPKNSPNGEDTWLQFDDCTTVELSPEPFFTIAATSLAFNPMPNPAGFQVSAAYLSAKVHPEPLSPDSLAAASPAPSFFATPDKGVFTPALGEAQQLASPFSQAFGNSSTPPARSASSLVSDASSHSAPSSPLKTPHRKPPPPPSGLKPASNVGQASEQAAASTSAASNVDHIGKVEPLSPSSDLFMKVGGLGAPAKLPPEWTALRPNPVYEPDENGQPRRRRSSDGDLVQEKTAPLVAEIDEPETLGDASATKLTQPISPDASQVNLLEDDWFGQFPASPTSQVLPNGKRADAKLVDARVAGLRRLTESDRKKCTAAYSKIARPGRDYVTRAEAEGIFSRAAVPGQPFESVWALSSFGGTGVLSQDEFCVFLLLMKAAAQRGELPSELSAEDLAQLLGHPVAAGRVAPSSNPPSSVRTPSKESSDRDIILSPDPELPPSVLSTAPQLESPTARRDVAPVAPQEEAWEDYLAKRVGSSDEKPAPAEPEGVNTTPETGDYSPGVSRIPSPSQRGDKPLAGGVGSPALQTVRPPSVVNRPLASQSLRIRVGTDSEDAENESKRFVGERIRRFSSQEGGIAYLVGMGFGPKAAENATSKFGSDLQAAVTWLLEQPDRGVDPADVLASKERDPLPLTPSPTPEKSTVKVYTGLISSDSPPPGRSPIANRHVAAGESKIPTPPRRDASVSPVKKPPGSLLRAPTLVGPPPKNLGGSLSFIDRIGSESDDSEEEEEDVGRPQTSAPASPLGQMIGSLWGGQKTVPSTPTGQTKIEKGIVAHHVEKFEREAGVTRGPQYVTQLPVEVLIEEVVMEDADDLRDPFITVSVYDESGALIEPAQNTSIVSTADERSIVFGTSVALLGKLSAVPPAGTKVCFEVRQFKRGETSKASTECWTAINLEEMANGAHSLVLFKKPVDLRAKRAKLLNGKRDVLKMTVVFQH